MDRGTALQAGRTLCPAVRACVNLGGRPSSLNLTRPTALSSGLHRTLRRPTRAPCARPVRPTPAASREEPSKEEQPTLPLEPFLRAPFVRSLVLGIAAAAALESVHGGLQFWGQLSDVAAPLYLADHLAAIGGWALFFGMEVLAIVSVLRLYPNNPEAAARAASSVVTLPRRLLPLHLTVLRRLLNPLSAPQLSSGAATAAGAAQPVPPMAAAFVDAPVAPGAVPPLPPQLGAPRGAPLGGLTALPPRPAAPPTAAPGEGGLAERRARRGLRPGQLDEDASGFARRQKELAGREGYLKNFWYAAALSESLKAGEPLGVELCGQKLVLFRGAEGGVHCLGDVCPHRGAPLSGGWVAQAGGHDCVVCPYHGWAFDAEGRLRDVPAAEGEGHWPKRPLVDTYPVEERGGFVWVFFGSKQMPAPERPPIPFVPELEAEGWKAVYGEIEFDCNHYAVFENAIDMAHIHYLHSDSFGNQEQPRIRGMRCATDAYGITATFALNNRAMAGWEWAKVPEVAVTARAFLPSTSAISFTLGAGLSFTTFVNTVPLGPNRTVNRFALVRNLAWDSTGLFNADAWDVWARQAMLRILGEDKGMVELLRPDLLPREFSVRADLPQVAFRKLRQQYVDLGYGVPLASGVERFRSDF